MKLTKSALRQMIREAVGDVAKSKQVGRLTQHLNKQFRKRGKEKNAEVSPQENNIIQQVLDALTKIASAQGVELSRHRPQISALLKKLLNTTGAELGGEEAAEEVEEER